MLVIPGFFAFDASVLVQQKQPVDYADNRFGTLNGGSNCLIGPQLLMVQLSQAGKQKMVKMTGTIPRGPSGV